MVEFQWWVLILGLVAGGTLVGLLTASFSRRDADLAADERKAEATFIAGHLALDRATVEDVLEAHREYLGLPAPDAIVPADEYVRSDAAIDFAVVSAGDRDPDDEPDDVGHGRRGAADRDLPSA
jgi:hypothetical protein